MSHNIYRECDNLCTCQAIYVHVKQMSHNICEECDENDWFATVKGELVGGLIHIFPFMPVRFKYISVYSASAGCVL